MDADDRGEGRPRRRWGLHLSWPALLLLGWLLYEFTAQPGLAAAVACAKFGWADVRAACWLRRVDPDRQRGRTCFWCYLTFGLWKVAVMATVTMIALSFLGVILDRVPRQPAGNNAFAPVLGGVVAAAGVGFGLSFLTTYVALGSALRNGVRIWLGHAPDRARRERFWPPRHGRVNAAPFVAFTTMILTLWMLMLLVVGLVIVGRPNVLWGMLILVGMLVTIGILVLGLIRLSGRLFARTPAECWVALDGEEVYQADEPNERLA
jgi:hypothetical protein